MSEELTARELIVWHACQDELLKIADQEPVGERLLKAGPMLGAIAGGSLGALGPKGGRASRIAGGALTGASVGWLPDIFYSGTKALAPKKKRLSRKQRAEWERYQQSKQANARLLSSPLKIKAPKNWGVKRSKGAITYKSSGVKADTNLMNRAMPKLPGIRNPIGSRARNARKPPMTASVTNAVKLRRGLSNITIPQT